MHNQGVELAGEVYGLSPLEHSARAFVKGAIDLSLELLPQPVSGWLRIGLGERLPFSTYGNQLLIREILDRILERNANCIDVGANKGHFTKLFTRLAPDGKHIAIEPLAEMFNVLCGKFMSNHNVKIYQAALANETRMANFYSFDQMPELSGLSRRTISGQAEPREMAVWCMRLDDIVPGNQSIRFIKIDVEGAELDVLKGGAELIKRSRPFIWCEHSLDGAPAFGVAPLEFFTFATQQLNMKLFTAHDWLVKGIALDQGSFENLVNSRVVSDFLLVPADS